MLATEREHIGLGRVVVGLDEVGRGALAGPMLVGAVVVTSCAPPPTGLDDSKRLTPARRERLVEPIRAWATDWALGAVDAPEIDEWGLRFALAVAANRALGGLTVRPTHALIDGPLNILRAPTPLGLGDAVPPVLVFDHLATTTLVRGDRSSATIAAASILAKVERDRQMVELASACASFGWEHNKGYGSPAHLAALRREGPNNFHRRSWNLPEAAERPVA